MNISDAKVELVLSHARNKGEFTSAQMRAWVGSAMGPTAIRNAMVVLQDRGDIELLTPAGKGHVGRWRVTAPIRLDPVADSMGLSMRARVIEALEHPPAGKLWYYDIRQLEKAVRRPSDSFGHHELMHVVHSLAKQGLATFEERKRGNGSQHDLLYIRKHPKSVGSGPVKTRRIEGEAGAIDYEAPTGFVNPGPDATPAQVDELRATQAGTTEGYPVIEALRRRSSEIAQAAKHLEAAGLDDLALATLAKADDLTPLEREVLRYFSTGHEASEVPTSPPSSASARGATDGTST